MLSLELKLTDERYEYDAETTVVDFQKYFRQRRTSEIGLFEFGIDLNRFDLILVNCHSRKIRVFEFKVTRQDFLRDEKWKYYLPYCHTFTFVTPPNLITIEDLNPIENYHGVGFMNIYKWRHNATRNWQLDSHWLKKPRGRIVKDETYIKIISLLLQRAKYRKEEIF